LDGGGCQLERAVSLREQAIRIKHVKSFCAKFKPSKLTPELTGRQSTKQAFNLADESNAECRSG
jgi:hypothetical protein